MSRKLLVRYRSKVIEDTISIEGYSNAIITMHYLGSLSEAFFWEVLQDELFNNGLRINILGKVLVNQGYIEQAKDIIDKARRLGNIRNHFAHCNTTRSQGEDSDFPEGVPNPKKPDQNLDFEKLYSEFKEKYESVSKAMIEIMDEMGIPFIHDTDTGTMTAFFMNEQAPPAMSEKVKYETG